jgi:hypothetical protein
MPRATPLDDDSTTASWLAELPADLAACVDELRQHCPTEQHLVITVMRQAWQDNEAQHLRTRKGLLAGKLTPAQRLSQRISEAERAAAWRPLAEQRREMQLPYEDRQALHQQREIEAELASSTAPPADPEPEPAAKPIESQPAPPGPDESPVNRTYTSPSEARDAFYAIPGNRDLGQTAAFKKYRDEGWLPKQSRSSFFTTTNRGGRPRKPSRKPLHGEV